jgi:hypothetical protein
VRDAIVEEMATVRITEAELARDIHAVLAKVREVGYAPVPDPDFAGDVQAAIDAHREPLNLPAWD